MGTSGEMSTSNTHVKYHITLTVNWQSVTDNCSGVQVSVYFWRNNTGYQTYGSGTCYCKVANVDYTSSVGPSQKITENGITLFSREFTVYHDADGSKYFDAAAWISMNTPLTSSPQYYGEWLPSIPRTSNITISASHITMGTSLTIYTNRASSNFTHYLYYQIGSGSWVTISGGIGSSYTWTVPTSFATLVPSGTSLIVQLYLETYNNGNYIGTSNTSFTAWVPGTFLPTINSVTLSETTSGISSKFGAFIQGHSKIRGTISASGSNGSTISSYSTTINGQILSGSTFTTSEITGSGTLSAVTTVKDSRGNTANRTTNYSVLSYSKPYITTFSAYRCNSSGTADDQGTYVKFTINATITSLNSKNDHSMYLKYKRKIDSSYTSVSLTSSYTYNSYRIISGFNTDYEYDAVLVVTDYFSTTSQSLNIQTAFTLMDFNSTGRGIGIGRVSTEDNLSVNMTTKLLGDTYIGVSGTTNNSYVYSPTMYVYGTLRCDSKQAYFNYGAYFNDATTFASGYTHNLNGTVKIGTETMQFSSGTWTPRPISRGGTNPSYSTYYKYGYYKRINNLCYISFHSKWEISSAGSDYAAISGLPYTSSSSSDGYGLAMRECVGALTFDSYGTNTAYIPDSSSMIYLQKNNAASASQWQTGTVWVGFTGWYLI